MFHDKMPVENNTRRLKMVENNRGGKAAGGTVEKKNPIRVFFQPPGQRRLKLKVGNLIFQPPGQMDAVEHHSNAGGGPWLT